MDFLHNLWKEINSTSIRYPSFFLFYTMIFAFFILLFLEIYVYFKIKERKGWVFILLPKIQYFFMFQPFLNYYILVFSLLVIFYLRLVYKTNIIELLFIFVTSFELYAIIILNEVILYLLTPIYLSR